MHLRIRAVQDGRDVPIPQDLHAIVIETRQGGIYIDLGSPVPDMVLMRATYTPENPIGSGEVRLILSPMSGRMAVGAIKT